MATRSLAVLILKAVAVWGGILILAVANGMVREFALVPWFGKTTGFIVSGVALSVVIVVVAYFSYPWFGQTSLPGFACIGVGWLILTLLFETSFGRMQGKSWAEILDAYRFQDGNIWPAVLLVITCSPYIVARLRARS